MLEISGETTRRLTYQRTENNVLLWQKKLQQVIDDPYVHAAGDKRPGGDRNKRCVALGKTRASRY